MASLLKKVAAAVVIVCSAGIGGLWFAPATWLDFIVSQSTNGQLRIAQAQGSLWNGRGVLALDLGDMKPLTQELQFSLRPVFLAPGFSMQLSGKGLRWAQANAEIVYRNGSLQIPAGELEGPVIHSAGLPSLLGLSQASAQMNIRWPAVIWSEAGVSGQGRVLAEFNNISSALSPIRPLASLRAELSLANPESKPWIASTTEDSVIMLTAQGDLKTNTAQGSLRCQRFCDYVHGVLLLLGKPSGEDYVFSFDPD